MNRIWLVLTALPLLFINGGCTANKVSASTRERVPARAYQVDWADFVSEQRYAAVTEPETQLDLAFQTGGVVTSIYEINGRPLEPGDHVPAGAVLAQLRVTEYQARSQTADAQLADATAARSAAEASVQEAEAAATQAREDLKRAQGLFDVQAQTKADLDAVRARHDAAQARLSAARTNVEGYAARINAASASQDENRVPLADTTLRAPFPAEIVARKVERGSSVAAGTVAYTLADLRIVKLGFGVADNALAQFAPGTAVLVNVDALPGKPFRGRILAVSPAADPVNRLFRATVAVGNVSGPLKAGMVASVIGENSRKTRELAIPLRAIRRLSGKGDDFGVLVIQDNSVQARQITLGPTLGTMIAVRSGLKPGELIAEDAGARLSPGDPVQVVR